jgi:hypothetical protein
MKDMELSHGVESLVSTGEGESLNSLLGRMDATNAAMMLSAAADVTLVVNAEGVICDRVLLSPELPEDIFIGWPGKALIDIVTVESRPKVEQMLREAAMSTAPRWRQVNHPSRSGDDFPIRYMAMKAGRSGETVVVGRDMRSAAVMQQRLLAAEQSIQEEYTRLRHAGC